MSEFKKYRREQIAELRPVTQNDIDLYNAGDSIPASFQFNISISSADQKNGSPKIGDMIARNPKNHNDQWLVAKDYFDENFEPVEQPKTCISTKICYHAGRPTDPREVCELDRVSIFRDTNIITALSLFQEQCLEAWPSGTQIVIDNIKLKIK